MEHAQAGAVVVKGNHDEAVAQPSPYMNEQAREAIEWARKALSEEEKAFLAGLPLTARHGAVCFAHASADRPERWSYVDSSSAALRSVAAAAVPYTFSGHVHEQVLFGQIGGDRVTRFNPRSGDEIPVGAHRRWLALVGSVGQPRDGSPAAAYALFDEERARLTYFRVPYDHHAAARSIRNAGLPEALAYRVERGI